MMKLLIGVRTMYIYSLRIAKIIIIIILGPIKEGNVPKASKEEGKSSLHIVNNEDRFDKEARELKQV